MEIPATLYTKSGGTNLAYQIFGSGPPVIVIPLLISNIELGGTVALSATWPGRRGARAQTSEGRRHCCIKGGRR